MMLLKVLEINYFIQLFSKPGHVSWRNGRNPRCYRACTVCKNSGSALQANFQMCFQSPFPG